MDLLHKIRTARGVLARYGVREVLHLLGCNAVKLARRWQRRLGSLFSRCRRSLLRTSSNDGRFRILYIATQFEVENGETSRYRIDNLRQALRQTVRTRYELLENGIWNDEAGIAWADAVVVMRAMWSDQLENLFRLAHMNRIPVVFDVDDLVFLPEFSEKFIQILPPEFEKELPSFTDEFSRQEKTFRQADFATASTEFIASKMREQGKEAFVIPNGFNLTQQRIAEKARSAPRPAGVRYIVYMSGTRTHDRDLMQAVPALVRIVTEYPDVRFRLIGYMDETLLPPALAARTETVPFMNWKKLMRFAAQNTVNIAPLDVANPFCHAKSELKYFEAAVAGVPTVASPTDTFCRCIENGVNGFLAGDDAEWYRAFRTLLDDPARYAAVRDEAMRRAQAEYSPRAIAGRAETVYREIVRRVSEGKNPRPV